MVCIECYLPFIAVVMHFLFPYFAAIVERLTGFKLQAPKPAVCPLPQGKTKAKKVSAVETSTIEPSTIEPSTIEPPVTKASTSESCCANGEPSPTQGATEAVTEDPQ